MDTETQALWRALQPLRSVACWLMTGAHPDDEWNGFLAWLAFGQGVRTVFGCATRGEGGQNALGPERGRALGVLRSREMELAAAEIDLSVRWLGAGPAHGEDDPIHDFGFSRSGRDTLARWGEARLVERLVRLIRVEQPDAISPTFLDVPGQHGHHRAVTAYTLRAVELAAVADFVLPGPPLALWRTAKVYLPAFSGAGASYDDSEPPPAETASVDLGRRCAPLAASWAQLGERSRRFHASQGMGRDLPDGPRPFPLHLASGEPDNGEPLGGVARSLGDLAGLLPNGATSRALRDADQAIAEAVPSFPEKGRVAAAAHRALAALADANLPDGVGDLARRVALKRRQLGRVAGLALGVSGSIGLPEELRAGTTTVMSLAVRGSATARVRVPDGWRATRTANDVYALDIPAEAFGTQRDGFDPLGGDDVVGVTLEWTHGGSKAAVEIVPPRRMSLAPATEASVSPHRLVRAADSATPATLLLLGAEAPASWPVCGSRTGTVEIVAGFGRHDLPSAGARLARFAYPHVGPLAFPEAATASVLRLPVAIPRDARVGVVAGPTDETLEWLRQLDIDAQPVDDATLAAGDLGRFTTILVGVFGFGQRPALRMHRDRLMAWTRSGGSLVTFYHRPEDGWDEGRTPPFPIMPGRPSLRWRVTDPATPVTVLALGHPILNIPNVITAADWEGWVRERGLYFASAWDAAYTPLLELADAGEPPLRGALLAAPVGKGRHIHVALALHHQFRALVPGAFRLLANLVAPLRP